MPIFAQNAADYEGLKPSAPAGQFQFSLGGGYRSDADIDSGGKFSESDLRAAAAGMFPVSDQIKLGTMLSYQFSHYDFSGVSPGYWDDVHILRATPMIQYRLDEHWRVYGGPSFGFSAANGADWGQSFTAGGLVGFNYRFGPTLSWAPASASSASLRTIPGRFRLLPPTGNSPISGTCM